MTDGSEKTAFLSARVPVSLRNRFKAVAAQRGLKVQELLNELLTRYTEGLDRREPSAAEILHLLRAQKERLMRLGLQHLYLTGALARGEPSTGQEVSLSYELDPQAGLSLLSIGRVGDIITASLPDDLKVTLVPRKKTATSSTYASSTDDEIRVF
ncbi:nucleotidyltransferase domain-containing protein [Pannonibacter sp. Pt2]|uniref:Nucleotidyltransferase domain-containing protein n=1 Tax=Pannonibacter anstelovis TaxID=3121537 RepID=A0ABU7ZS88_9HYPH